jgi:uncharacterized membrane protein YfcA
VTLLTPGNAHWILLSGAAAGFFGSILGVGGGIILVPLLVLVFHVPIHFAIGTSIMTVIATSSMAGTFNLERGTVNIRLGMFLEVATTLGALLGGTLAGAIRAPVLTTLFGAILPPIALLMWRKGNGGPSSATQPETSYRMRRLPVAMGLSLGAGTVSGLLGIGGGIIKVPAMTVFCNIPARIATATSTFMIGVTAVASAFLYFGRGQVRPALTAVVILGVLAGSAAGTQVARRLRSHQLIRLFALLLVFASVQMLFRGIRGLGD